MKAGLAGLHDRLIRNLDPMIASRSRGLGRLAFFPGMGLMLSDQALKQGRLENALAHTGDEGRSKLR